MAKIAMLYRAHTKLSSAHVELTPTLFIRVEVIEATASKLGRIDDLSQGLGKVKARAGGQFINCVWAA